MSADKMTRRKVEKVIDNLADRLLALSEDDTADCEMLAEIACALDDACSARSYLMGCEPIMLDPANTETFRCGIAMPHEGTDLVTACALPYGHEGPCN